MATRSSVRAWRISMDRGAWWATVHGVAKSQLMTEQLKKKGGSNPANTLTADF